MAETPFPQFITDRRRELELTLGDVASNIGVSPITVSNWSNGQSIPKTENLVALASVLELPAEELAEMAGVSLTADTEAEAEVEPETTEVAEEAAETIEVAEEAAETIELAEEAPVDEHTEEHEVSDLQDSPEVSIPTIEHPTLAEAGTEAEALAAEADLIEEGEELEDPPKVELAVEAPPAPKQLDTPPVPDSVPDVIPRVTVSAPSTTQLSPLTYVQDPRQLLRYRIRWGITTVVLIIMAFVLVWALGELFTALSDVKESVTP